MILKFRVEVQARDKLWVYSVKMEFKATETRGNHAGMNDKEHDDKNISLVRHSGGHCSKHFT